MINFATKKRDLKLDVFYNEFKDICLEHSFEIVYKKTNVDFNEKIVFFRKGDNVLIFAVEKLGFVSEIKTFIHGKFKKENKNELIELMNNNSNKYNTFKNEIFLISEVKKDLFEYIIKVNKFIKPTKWTIPLDDNFFITKDEVFEIAKEESLISMIEKPKVLSKEIVKTFPLKVQKIIRTDII